MTTQYYQNLFEYDTKVNNALFEQLTNNPLELQKAKETLAHIIAAKQVWMSRLSKQSASGITIWPEFQADKLKDEMDKIREEYNHFLSSLLDEDLTQNLQYTNSKGKAFETPIRDILTHVLVHGGHHRGQIAKYVRKAGGEPLNTDYITHVRDMD